MRVRAASADDRIDAVRVLDGALLEVADVEDAIGRGDVLVACVDGPDGADPGDERVVGVIVLEPHDEAPYTSDTPDTADVSESGAPDVSESGAPDVSESGAPDVSESGAPDASESGAPDASESGAHVAAIAVNPSRRGRGVGSALVEAASDRYGRLTADFRAEVEPFWRSLGFAVEERGDRRWGERS